ncbi:MAG TPA: hypothetical protein PKG52_02890 [bacterium]|nr:hypothetical protein [bacterium]HPS30727.1 hypothetical protein [bacterium]
MKKRLCAFFALLAVMLIPMMVSAGMLKIMVGYKKGFEKSDHVRVDIKDWYWKMPVVQVPKSLEREKYSVVIEGYEAIRKHTDTLELTGASVSRNSILFPVDGLLRIENKENFPRILSILQEGEKNDKIEITVPAKGTSEHVFMVPGDYTIVDTLFQWNTVYIKVLKSSYIFPIDEGPNRFEIPDISPGSYTIRIYYGTRWIYQEDFVMVSNSPQSLVYKIDESSVSSVNSIVNLGGENIE